MFTSILGDNLSTLILEYLDKYKFKYSTLLNQFYKRVHLLFENKITDLYFWKHAMSHSSNRNTYLRESNIDRAVRISGLAM